MSIDALPFAPSRASVLRSFRPRIQAAGAEAAHRLKRADLHRAQLPADLYAHILDPMRTSSTAPVDSLKILIVEDSPTDAELLVRSLQAGLTTPFETEVVESLRSALECLAQDSIGLIITDLNLPDSSGLGTFDRLHEQAGDVPVVIISGLEDIEMATESVRKGAQDYVVKGQAAVESLARSVRFAVERGRRIKAERERDQAKRELEVAHRIQKSLYPDRSPFLEGFELAGAVWSAERACGDYYDFFLLPDSRLGVALGDVCGHGLPAALTMMQVRVCLRMMAHERIPPGELLSNMNTVLLEEGEAARRFTSLFYGEIDLRNGTLEFASAGHPAYVVHHDRDSSYLAPTVAVIGIMDDIGEPRTVTHELQSGDCLFIPTDGFCETMNSDRALYGEERMLETVRASLERPAGQIIQDLYSAIRHYAGLEAQEDDMAAIAFQVA